MRVIPFVCLASAFGLAVAAPAVGQETVQPVSAMKASEADFAQFVPRPSGTAVSIDYSFFDEALEYMVLRMGQSTRQGSTRPAPSLGTRQVYGHDSRVRLEGNRVAFSFLTEEAITPLTEYRQDLERLGGELDIASLPREEQLAYWINLHNVAVIEQIALAYPVRSPSRMKLGPNKTPLDETPVVTVAGVSLSPRDIRTKIVFPNWDDPKVIYGFFRGEVGGPSIQRAAYNADLVDNMLRWSAEEFINSLRGVEAWGGDLMVSKIYEEAAPFYFPQMADDFRGHLTQYAGDEVKDLIARKEGVKFNSYEDTVADLAGGEREPSYNTVYSDGLPQGTRVTPSIARYLGERYQKLEKLRREGLLRGRVIVLPPPTSGEAETAPAPATSDEPQAK